MSRPRSARKPTERAWGIEHQKRKDEHRRLCLGETGSGKLLTFVVTERRGKVPFVTAYPMHPKQREIYRGEER